MAPKLYYYHYYYTSTTTTTIPLEFTPLAPSRAYLLKHITAVNYKTYKCKKNKTPQHRITTYTCRITTYKIKEAQLTKKYIQHTCPKNILIYYYSRPPPTYECRMTNYECRITTYKRRTTTYEYRIPTYKRRITTYK